MSDGFCGRDSKAGGQKGTIAWALHGLYKSTDEGNRLTQITGPDFPPPEGDWGGGGRPSGEVAVAPGNMDKKRSCI